MNTRISIHADFGADCSNSKDAEEYLRRVVERVPGLTFEQKLMRRTGDREVVVQFSVISQERLESLDAAEEVVDSIHHQALGTYGYENMEIFENGVETVGSPE